MPVSLNARTRKSGITQREIAERFKVSQITVSRALRRTGQVAPKLENALIDAARAAGYSEEMNFHARSLRHRRQGVDPVNNVICAIVFDAGHGENHFNARILRGIEQGAEENGSEIIVAPAAKGDRLPRVVARRQVDGVVWLLSDVDFYYRQPASPVPMVSLFYTLPGVDGVRVNDRAAMRSLGVRLGELGHRRVAFVGPGNTLAADRLQGLREGLATAGGHVGDEDIRLKPYVMSPDTTLPLVRDLMQRRQALPTDRRFTAMAVYNDYIATTALRCVKEEFGLDVPRELSITGFDGVAAPDAPPMPLTTLAVPLEQLGVEAARMIAWRMRFPNEPYRHVTCDAVLSEGETTGPANRDERR